MACKRCTDKPLPENWSERKCGFYKNGNFDGGNWNCGTLNALAEEGETVEGCDESMQTVYLGEEFSFGDQVGGWIILTRYKHRGRCTSAIRVGDFFPPQPVTLEMCEKFLEMKVKA